MTGQIDTILGLLVAVAALALLARKLSIPYPILLVLGGLALSQIHSLPEIQLDPKLVFVLFLPPLIYPAALFTSWRDFRANLRPIFLLAVGLVIMTTVTTGYFGHWLVPAMPLAAAFVLGAIISPPDAVAATAVTERLSVPQRVITVLEGESLINDATALVAYAFAIDSLNHINFSIGHAAARFLLVSVGGVATGLAIGWLLSHVQRRLDDPPVQITISILTSYASYLAADKLGVSGVLSVVATGLYLGWRSPEIINSRMRLQAGPVWEMIVFLLNGLVFILIGLQLRTVINQLPDGIRFRQLLAQSIALSLVVMAVRFFWVFVATYLPRWLSPELRAREPNPGWKSVTIVAWTGMRGVVSLAAALAIPPLLESGEQFPARNYIIFFTFVVILFTLVLQGLTLPLLIRWLKVVDSGETEREERLARLKANQAALARLIELEEAERFSVEHMQRLRTEYDDRIRQLQVCEPTPGHHHAAHLFSADYEELQREALRVERRTILQLRNERAINDHALRRIQRDLDIAEARLEVPA